MSTHTIVGVSAVQILDSRSRPTLQVTLQLEGQAPVTAGVPAGASTGSREALELRDGDATKYHGQGVTKAVANVRGELNDLLSGRSFSSQAELDQLLINTDGTANKGRLGSNAILGVSMAFARAAAAAEKLELWQWLPGVDGQPHRLPVPCFNVLNGGVHAQNPLDFQEFMISPLGAPNFAEALRAGSEIYGRLKELLVKAGHPVGLGDEGGFAPDIATPEDVLALLTEAITSAGYPANRDGVMIALDPASSEFYSDGRYTVEGKKLTSDEIISRYAKLVENYPLWSIEDGVAQDDHAGWQSMTKLLGQQIQIVGDDNFCTNPAIIAEAIDDGIANAALIKLNQIGTVTETLEAMRLCKRHGYGQMVSHRSGETPDSFIADLVVAAGCGQIKSGAPARGERVAKYNRLVAIADANPDLPFGLR